MDTIVTYYKLCNVAAGGRAHSANFLAAADRKKLNVANFLNDRAEVAESVIGGSDVNRSGGAGGRASRTAYIFE